LFDAEEQGVAQADLVRRMAATLAHRGPDDDGFYVSPRCVLGHRRLKIIDLSPSGRQPMTNEDGSLWISFNGEVYNYLPLRAALARRGHQFRSQTDTEVMLHLYEERGEEFLQDLNGMLALALWDERRGRLLLATDRFGKKPLYYFADGRRLLFGSELKALLADPSVPRELDPEALSAYLALGYIPSPATIFRGIRKLPPASWMVVERDPQGGGVRLRGPQRYWSLRYAPNPALTEAECTGRIREILRDAVRIRMYSDVPLGAFLSGGLDSSTVVATMAKVSDHPVETFSIGFDQASFDELHFAEMLAKQYRTNHHTLRCTPDALEVLPTLVHHYDEPFADSSAIPTYYVSKIARQCVTVALSGDGGDETFAGYTRYDNGMLRWKLAQFLPDSLIRGAFRLLTDLYPLGSRGWGILHRNSLAPLDSFTADVSIYQPREKYALLRAAPGSGSSAANGDTFSFVRGLAGQAGSREFLSQMQYVDQMLYLPDDILVKVDRASMAVALEVRAPLLDYRLAEFMATVPAGLRYRQGSKKYVLKKAAAGMVPDEIIHRSKMGFGVPLKHWFRKEAASFARDVLLSTSARQRGLFNGEEVERVLARHAEGRRDFSNKIWALLFFELWCQTWLDRPPVPPAEVGEVTSCPAP
jgi:asparagine synthase (glutamine-hydrolysing)